LAPSQPMGSTHTQRGQTCCNRFSNTHMCAHVFAQLHTLGSLAAGIIMRTYFKCYIRPIHNHNPERIGALPNFAPRGKRPCCTCLALPSFPFSLTPVSLASSLMNISEDFIQVETSLTRSPRDISRCLIYWCQKGYSCTIVSV